MEKTIYFLIIFYVVSEFCKSDPYLDKFLFKNDYNLYNSNSTGRNIFI